MVGSPSAICRWYLSQKTVIAVAIAIVMATSRDGGSRKTVTTHDRVVFQERLEQCQSIPDHPQLHSVLCEQARPQRRHKQQNVGVGALKRKDAHCRQCCRQYQRQLHRYLYTVVRLGALYSSANGDRLVPPGQRSFSQPASCPAPRSPARWSASSWAVCRSTPRAKRP